MVGAVRVGWLVPLGFSFSREGLGLLCMGWAPLLGVWAGFRLVTPLGFGFAHTLGASLWLGGAASASNPLGSLPPSLWSLPLGPPCLPPLGGHNHSVGRQPRILFALDRL